MAAQIYNGVFFWSALAQQQYLTQKAKCGGESPGVTENDVAFAVHALVLTLVHILQIAIYDVCARAALRPPSLSRR